MRQITPAPATHMSGSARRPLIEAERNAEQLFAEVVDRGPVAPGKGDRDLSDEIRDLANHLFGGFFEQLLDLRPEQAARGP